MESLENKEIKFTQGMEKVIMYFMYLVFGGVFAVIAWSGTLREAWIMLSLIHI